MRPDGVNKSIVICILGMNISDGLVRSTVKNVAHFTVPIVGKEIKDELTSEFHSGFAKFYELACARVRAVHFISFFRCVFCLLTLPTFKFSVPEAKTSKHSYTVGKIEVYLSDIIGHGSEGTVVFK
jgi:hypothetical protein